MKALQHLPLRRGGLLAAATVSAALLAGCGVPNPKTPTVANSSTTTATRSTTGTATNSVPASSTNPLPAPEQGGTVPSTSTTAGGKPPVTGTASPAQAIEQYTLLSCQWTYRNAAARQKQAELTSTSGAQALAAQSAASIAADSALKTGHVTSACQIQAVSPQLHKPGTWVVVFSQTTTTTGSGTLPAQFHVAYAQATKTKTGWVTSQWSPQS